MHCCILSTEYKYNSFALRRFSSNLEGTSDVFRFVSFCYGSHYGAVPWLEFRWSPSASWRDTTLFDCKLDLLDDCGRSFRQRSLVGGHRQVPDGEGYCETDQCGGLRVHC